MNILSNAFSLQMCSDSCTISKQPCTSSEVPEDAISYIGHQDMANVLSGILGRPVEVNRGRNFLHPEDVLYVAQYMGGRLPEGAITLPEGAEIKFFKITVDQ